MGIRGNRLNQLMQLVTAFAAIQVSAGQMFVEERKAGVSIESLPITFLRIAKSGFGWICEILFSDLFFEAT